MARMKIRILFLAAVLALVGACNRDQSGGPGEKAGRAVDRALDKAGQSIEKAGQNLQDASKGKK
jgi:hypothetical protein